ncbi:MAG: RecQ family zinc-binding domain-containing protein, partial [Acidobacteria bacterium]|nr:RecQ family zinc-binding domain-containing protein [Acidobacteriota bacterium]
AGATESLPSGEVRALENIDPGEVARNAAEEQERRREAKRERLEKMREYADSSRCRREILLQYFGEEFQAPCDFCDRCEAASGKISVDPSVGTRREVT